MATRAAIIVEVNPCDLKKTRKVDYTKFPTGTPVKDWEHETCKSLAKGVKLDKCYIGIYNHFDGDCLGETLKTYFNDYEKALNLVLGGDISYLYGDGYGYKPYALRACENWQYISPVKGDNLQRLANRIAEGDYVWVFKDGEWQFNPCGCVTNLKKA